MSQHSTVVLGKGRATGVVMLSILSLPKLKNASFRESRRFSMAPAQGHRCLGPNGCTTCTRHQAFQLLELIHL